MKGWVEDWTAKALEEGTQRHHSVAVRFKAEDGGYEWLWVRHNNVAPCPTKPRRRKSSTKGEAK
mgnify:CR=1 FL=1